MAIKSGDAVLAQEQRLLSRNDRLPEASIGDAPVSQVSEFAIIALSLDGIIESWNLGAQRLKGYTAEEAIGRNFTMFYSEADQVSGLPQRMLATARQLGYVEHRGWRVRKDGQQFWGDVVITAVRGESGQVVGYTKVTRDLTLQHRLEQEQAALYRVMAHDIRTPITSIAMFAALIAITDDPAERSDYAERIQANAFRLDRLTTQMVDFAKLRSADMTVNLEAVNLAELAATCAANLATLLKAHRVVVKPSPLMAKADPVATDRIVDNLLVNAAKYSPEGSTITVVVERAGDYVCLRVADEGRGIAPEDVGSIFGEYNRGRLAEDDGGTGLGLASVRLLAELQAGRASLTSTLGVGTIVTVELPLATLLSPDDLECHESRF
jgi:PAS domain S-box-containing protein